MTEYPFHKAFDQQKANHFPKSRCKDNDLFLILVCALTFLLCF